mmetsp:Transcript_93/g.264  ORF Transcript_93/g.264 Transcript_93/m.264 type:complete len:475 (-) Transcript_93:50-1474(-)
MAAAAASVVARRQYLDDLARDGQASAVVKKATTTDLPPEGKGIWRWQRQAAKGYIKMRVQLSVAALIASNFIANIIEKWIDPTAEQHAQVWDLVDMFFNLMFTVELVWNMYAFWFWRFWRSGWNIFDFVVVTIGILNMSKIPLPGPFALLRMMRAFRVFRLFKRVRSLNDIMVSLARAVPGVSNAFVVLLLVMSIYAIVGQEFFMYHAANHTYINDQGYEVELITARGLDYGYDYWGNFCLALYTMFQVLTTESWSEVVGRPLLNSNDAFQQLGVAAFFGSYNLVVGIVLINVVVAVLLEKMMAQKEGEDLRNDMHRNSEVPSPRSSARRTSAASTVESLKLKDVTDAPAHAMHMSEVPPASGDEYAMCAMATLQSQLTIRNVEVNSESLKDQLSPKNVCRAKSLNGWADSDLLPGVNGVNARSADVLEIEADCARLKHQLAMVKVKLDGVVRTLQQGQVQASQQLQSPKRKPV